MEDRRSGAQGCLLWTGLSEAGPSALQGRPCMKQVPDALYTHNDTVLLGGDIAKP